MPEFATFVSATETPMAGFMGRIRLLCGADNVVLDRVNSRAGMPMLTDHRPDLAIGMVKTLEARGGQVEGESELVETERNRPYLEELRAGLRRGISPGFLIHQGQAIDDPDFEGEIMLQITRWEAYEQSATPVPRNSEAGLIRIANRSDSRASMEPPAQAEIQEKVDAEVSAQVAALEKKIAETGTVLETRTKRQEKLSMELFSQVKNKNGQAEPETTAAMKYKAVFAAMLFGGPDPEAGDVVLDYVGRTGQMGTVKLRVDTEMAAAFDTTNAYGAVTQMGGALEADAYYETSPARILQLPRRIENIESDLQVPVLTQEPNSAMVAQNAARLAVVDATLAAAPPMLSPKRLQTVADISLQTTLVAPGFEDVLLTWMMGASDRAMAVQVLRGDGVAPNITGILNTTGILTSEYQTTAKGGQTSFFDAEDKLAVDVPADRRAWILAEDLFRTARRTLRDPGSGDYVIRRWDSQMRVLDTTMAIRTNTLTAGVGLYGEWSACTLGLWENMLMTIDRISVPGTIRLTLDRFYDFAVTRPTRFSVLKEA